MKAAILIAVGSVVLAACSPTPDEHALRHFWFNYAYQPQPGIRVWIKVNQTNWAVVYPDGSQARYRLEGRQSVEGLSGEVVSKTAGDVEKTQTLNDGSFQVFLPDKDATRMVLYFRSRIDGQWQSWRPLATPNPIE